MTAALPAAARVQEESFFAQSGHAGSFLERDPNVNRIPANDSARVRVVWLRFASAAKVEYSQRWVETAPR